jgi:hypothetical protein
MDVSGTGTEQEVTPRPEHELMLASFVGLALLELLNTLAPAERDPFVLHDMFDVSFNEIAPIVERSPAAGQPGTPQSPQAWWAKGGSVTAAATRRRVPRHLPRRRPPRFVMLLDPDVKLRADRAAVVACAADGVRGAAAVAEAFAGGRGRTSSR